MAKKLKIRLFSLALAVISVVILLTDNTKCNIPAGENRETSNEIYVVRLTDSGVALLKNEEIIKIYDIQPSVLPGEDILLLYEGISVNSVSEADSLAENFDG